MRQGTAALREFNPGDDRLGSFASDQRGQRLRRMSAVPPIATELMHCNELTRGAKIDQNALQQNDAPFDADRY
jgi:hypothetical protein